MRYCSTRGGVRGLDFRDVLFSGFASDGGMFMPEALPALGAETLLSWTGLSYPQLVVEVASLFIPTQLIPRDHLSALVGEALTDFRVPGAVSMRRLGGGLNVLELFHGTTFAFKDLAMSVTVHLLKYFLAREKRTAIIVVGTSGDTGGSAIHSVKGLGGIMDVVVAFPRGRVTAVQEKQMTTCLDRNVHVFAADGSSDDIDVVIRRLFADQDLVRSRRLMSLNSVNWSRVMVQLAHFIYAYLQLLQRPLEELQQQQHSSPAALPPLEVVVPTGGAGNIAAGCIVKQMGVPLRLVAMVNANDIVHRTVQRGDFSMSHAVTQTLAPAIDIQDPYNMERVFWLLSGRDGPLVKDLMEDFQRSHRNTLPEALHKQLSQAMWSQAVTDEGILSTMRRCWEDNGYVLCPHTAVAVWHHYHCVHQGDVLRCYVATASPAKFQAAVERAGLTFDPPEAVRALDQMATRCQNLERSVDWKTDWEERLRECIQSIHTSSRQP